MQIEKVTKYVNLASPSRSSSSTVTVRTVAMSLPRVRWLERDPDFKPSVEPEQVTIINGSIAGKSMVRRVKNLEKGMPLTNSEQRAYELGVVQKLSQRKACVHMGIAHSTYRQHLLKAKFKLGIEI